jgi:hypothetical protein
MACGTDVDWPDPLLLSVMDRAFNAALPKLLPGKADGEHVTNTKIALSRTLVELTSAGVTTYPDLLRLAVERLSVGMGGTAEVQN